jgi:hypothetical protein
LISEEAPSTIDSLLYADIAVLPPLHLYTQPAEVSA